MCRGTINADDLSREDKRERGGAGWLSVAALRQQTIPARSP
jgi:hypothetical protein